MSEEEKEAIEEIKLQIQNDKEDLPYSEECIKYKQTILDLIDKQQKEIKELNLENQAFYEEMNCDDNEYISKKYSQLKSVVEILANGIRVLGTNPDITTEEIIKEFTEKPISEEYMKKFESSYISKDKIRDKIKELEELPQNQYIYLGSVIDEFKKLLGE